MNYRIRNARIFLPALVLSFTAGIFAVSNGAAFQQDSGDTTAAQQETNRTADQALRDAAFEGQLTEVIAAHEEGGDVNAPDQNGGTALMLAAFNGHTETAAWLLEHRSNIDDRDAVGRTALMYASSGPFKQTVQLLLEQGADPNAADRFESWTPLMFASAEGNTGVVKILLSHGADARTIDDDGEAAIDHALQNNREETVRLLREHLGTSKEESK